MNNRNVHWAAIVIIPLLLMAAILVLNSLDFNHFKPTITAKVEEATGRTLSIAGDIELQLSLSPELSMEGLALSNAAWGSDKEMIT
ncbi:MAG: AsmA family protein, partial [Gammaproteobacteria bacterium]|nr:AsmA family protein [Gammaproteobacteria bacterium]